MIPDEAVEAAVWVVIAGQKHGADPVITARAALEAAAPYMLGSLLEEWAVQFAVGSVEEAEDEADAKRKLREIQECIADGMETPALEPMTIVRRYRLHETELTAWKPVSE